MPLYYINNVLKIFYIYILYFWKHVVSAQTEHKQGRLCRTTFPIMQLHVSLL